MIAKHYYRFDDTLQNKLIGVKLNEENWNILRNDEAEGPFSIEHTVEAYEANCRASKQYEEIAHIFLNEIGTSSENNIVSLGVGKGILEWHLKNLNPDLHIYCTDYTAEAIEKLKGVFLKMDDAYAFDMLSDDYSRLSFATYIVMHRISTEFDRKQWKTIFRDMYDCGLEKIIYIPTELASNNTIFREKLQHIKNRIKRRKDIFCGWLYSEDEFIKMFGVIQSNPLYIIKNCIYVGDTAVYVLHRTGTAKENNIRVC